MLGHRLAVGMTAVAGLAIGVTVGKTVLMAVGADPPGVVTVPGV